MWQRRYNFKKRGWKFSYHCTQKSPCVARRRWAQQKLRQWKGEGSELIVHDIHIPLRGITDEPIGNSTVNLPLLKRTFHCCASNLNIAHIWLEQITLNPCKMHFPRRYSRRNARYHKKRTIAHLTLLSHVVLSTFHYLSRASDLLTWHSLAFITVSRRRKNQDDWGCVVQRCVDMSACGWSSQQAKNRLKIKSWNGCRSNLYETKSDFPWMDVEECVLARVTAYLSSRVVL